MNRTIKTLLATTTLLVSAAPIMAQDADNGLLPFAEFHHDSLREPRRSILR
jgi:Spy/CpxP family protein refolding chaperone